MNTSAAFPLKRPASGTATERVWQIADTITRDTGRKARRKEVVEAYVAEGGNGNTASTQYQYWSQTQTRRHEPTAFARVPAFDRAQLSVDASGRVMIPPDYLAGMEIGPEGKVTARLVDGELHLISPRVALRKIRQIVQALPNDGGSVVDEFIAEKRREAARE